MKRLLAVVLALLALLPVGACSPAAWQTQARAADLVAQAADLVALPALEGAYREGGGRRRARGAPAQLPRRGLPMSPAEAAIAVFTALVERMIADGLNPEHEARRIAESYAARERTETVWKGELERRFPGTGE